MKKIKKYLCIGVLCIVSMILSVLCVNAATVTKSTISYEKNYASTAIRTGNTRNIYVVSKGSRVAASKVEWKSSNTAVASVKNGVITAKAYGTVYISAKLKNNNSNTVKFLLRVYESKRDVTLKVAGSGSVADAYVLEKGNTYTLNASLRGSYKRYASSNTKVITVDNTGKLTPKAAGNATITYITIGRYYCRTTINVIVGKRIQSIDAGVDDHILYMNVGEQYTIHPTVTPSNASVKKFEYLTTSTSGLPVSASGVITAKKAGIGYIRVKALDGSGVYTRFKVIISKSDSVQEIRRKKTMVIAHRGLASKAPENSLPAFELAAKGGLDGMECDVRATKDGHIVVIHDANLKRMCGVDKNVSDLTLEEIKKYPIISGSNANMYANNYIPTLDEFIACCNQYICTPMVEIKGNFTKEQLSKVYQSIKKSVKAPVVISFYRYNLRWLRAKDPALELQNVAWTASEDELKFCKEIRAGMSAEYISLTPDQIRSIQADGIKVATWNINDLTTFNYFLNLGVNYISTEMDFV